MRALRLLAGLQVDSLTVAMKLGADNEKKLERYRARSEHGQLGGGAESPPERHMRDNTIKQQILGVAAEYARMRAAPAGSSQPVEPAATAPAPTGLPQPVVQPQAPAPTPHGSDADRFLGGLLHGGGGSLESAPPNDRRRPDAQRRRAERLR